MEDRASLRRYATISIVAALATIALKGGAYLITGSVGLLSDALESLVNLAAAIVAFIALSAAARPEDEDHRYGHSKAEYFSSGFEGALIMLAAASILYTSVGRLLAPQAIQRVELGIGISIVAGAINLVVARILFRAGRRHQSITLEADAHHLMSDVWTSVGVIIGVGAAALTGWHRLDPIIAIAVATQHRADGREHSPALADGPAGHRDPRGSPPQDLRHLLPSRRPPACGSTRSGRARQARWRFIDFHVLVPGHWSVQRGHDLLEQIEEEVRGAVPNSSVFTHLEPIEDPASFADVSLERAEDAHRRPPESP